MKLHNKMAGCGRQQLHGLCHVQGTRLLWVVLGRPDRCLLSPCCQNACSSSMGQRLLYRAVLHGRVGSPVTVIDSECCWLQGQQFCFVGGDNPCTWLLCCMPRNVW